MSEFTVTEVAGSEDWGDDGQYGPKTTWKIALNGDQGRTAEGEYAELVTKRGSPAPTVGQTLNGALSSDRGRLRFKKDKPANGFGGGGQRDPKQQKQIVRQHSQEMAIRHLHLLQLRGKIPEDAGEAFLKKYIDWFQADAEGAA